MITATPAFPRRRLVKLGVGLLGAAVSVLATAACGTSAGAKGGSGAPFFKGKTITYIVPDPPGNINGLQIVAMQPAIEKYLHAKINIQYIPGETAIGQNKVGHAAADGLTIGMLPVKTDLSNLYANATPLAFDMQKVSFVGATYTGPTLVVACKGASYTSLDQLLQSTKQVKVVNVSKGADNEKAHLLMNAFDIPHKYINGYTGATAAVGCRRGDGDIAMESVSGFSNSAGTALDPGLTPLLIIGAIPSGSTYNFLDNVPTLTSFAASHQPSGALAKKALTLLTDIGQPTSPQFATFGPAGIPKASLDALSGAMKWAMQQPSVRKKLLTDGIPPGFVPPATVASYLKTQIAAKSTIEDLLTK